MTKNIFYCYCAERHKKYFLFVNIFIVLSVLPVFSNNVTWNAQSNKFSISSTNKTLKQILTTIEHDSEYVFIYGENVNEILSSAVSVSLSDKGINEVLDNLFANKNLAYSISGRQVMIISRQQPASQQVRQQDKFTITGNVMDSKGEPLIGVSVQAKNTVSGTVTNLEGSYTLTVANANTELEFSYLGYVSVTERVGGRKIINIILHENDAELDEVVVVGYGSQKRASVVASISTVTPGKLNVGTTRSVSNNLAGNVGGIIGVQRSGEPGYDNSDFWIRGISTFGKNKSPLVLVDGIERDLNNIDINEIESFSVLKDASASAVYGVRGANGVILITTKRGKAGKTTIGIKYEHAITQPVQLPDFLNAGNYMQLLDNVSVQDGGNVIYGKERIQLTRDRYDPELYPDVNWVHAISNDWADNDRVSLDINGGGEKIRYAFVAAYYGEDGIIKTDPNQSWDSSLKVNRFNMRSNVDVDITPSTLVRFNIGGYLQKRNSPPKSIDDLFKDAFSTPPYVHPEQYVSGEIPRRAGRVNPWASATQSGFEMNNRSKFESLFSVEQDLKAITKGLTAKAIFSYDYYNENGVKRAKDPFYYVPATTRDFETGALNLYIERDGQEFLGHEQKKEYGNNSMYFEASMSYDRIFGEHTVNGLLLYNQRQYDDGSKLPFLRQGFAGRTSYIFKNRYIAEFNFGYNGSENFAKGQRFGFFPSIAGGWIMTEEKFMEPYINTFNKIKFRASYGLAGNDNVDGRRFAYITTIAEDKPYKWGTGGNLFERNERREGDVGVPNLTWETVTKTNIGVELGLWKAIELQLDFFREERDNIFMQRKNFPNSAGFTSLPWANFGQVRNQGVEATIDINKQVNKDWFISVRTTATYAKNKILEQDESMGIIGTSRSSTGKPVGQLFGLKTNGLFTDDDFADVSTGELKPGVPVHKFTTRVWPGDIKYVDLDADGEITDKDRTAIGGTVDPQFVYGFGMNVTYRQIDFGFFAQGNALSYRIIGRAKDFIPGSNSGTTGNAYSNAYDSWTVDNPRQDAFYPRLHFGYNNNNAQESEWWLKNMSMLRLKNIEAGYTFAKQLIKPLALAHARVFVRGTNILCISDFKLWDPELDTPDNGGLRYPIMRTWSVGLDLTF